MKTNPFLVLAMVQPDDNPDGPHDDPGGGPGGGGGEVPSMGAVSLPLSGASVLTGIVAAAAVVLIAVIGVKVGFRKIGDLVRGIRRV